MHAKLFSLNKLDGRTKFLGALLLTIAMFIFSNPMQYIALFLFVSFVHLFFFKKEEIKLVYQSWKFYLYIVIISFVANSFFVNGNVLFKFFIFNITDNDFNLVFRIFLLLLISKSMLVISTEKELGFSLGKIIYTCSFHKIRSTSIPLITLITLLFIDTFTKTAMDVRNAYLLRYKFNSSPNIVDRLKINISLLSPLTMITLKKAEKVSLSLMVKGFHRDSKIVNYQSSSYIKADYFAYLILFILILSLLKMNGFA